MKRLIAVIVSCVAVVACLPATFAQGQATKVQDLGEVLAGPAEHTDAAAWLADVQQWRKDHRAALRYDGADYARPELAWGQRSFIQPQMMVEERTFYDPVAGKYTVDRYLDDLEARYGGIDSVLIWPVYPRGASPFGVMDLQGNVWQWTDEYVDDHTRAAVLRGGSYYRPSGSRWYFPQTTSLLQHQRYLLMAPCKDRAGTLGFRCVADRNEP